MGVARSDLVQGKNGLSGPVVKGNTDGVSLPSGEIGEVIRDYEGAGLSFNTTVATALTISIPAGVWILNASCSHNRNGPTYSRVWLRNTTDGEDIKGAASSSNQGDKYSEYACVVYFKCEATKTVEMLVQSSSGGSASILPSLTTGGLGQPQGGRQLQATRIA